MPCGRKGAPFEKTIPALDPRPWLLVVEGKPNKLAQVAQVVSMPCAGTLPGPTWLALYVQASTHPLSLGIQYTGVKLPTEAMRSSPDSDNIRSGTGLRSELQVVEDDERCYEYDCTFKKTPAAMTVEASALRS